jgi:ParB-like chromosome segregation protein Spo0J
MTIRFENILVKSIFVEEEGRLPLAMSHVGRLEKSIKEVGLLEPIIICRRAVKTPSVVLVAGRHRLEACRKLKHKTIAAIVENEDSPTIERWRALAEIDENLIRRELTAAQRARLVSKRKAAYEAVHPEAKHGATGRRGKKDANLASFSRDTAIKTGKPERTVQRDATRAKALGSDLDRVAGTSLDKGAELDALAIMPPETRAPIIQRAASGEEVSAIRAAAAKEPKPGYAELTRSWKAFRTAWLRASAAGKDAFVSEASEEIDAIFGEASTSRKAS